MKKISKVLALLLTFMLVISITACGSSGSDKASDTAGTTAAGDTTATGNPADSAKKDVEISILSCNDELDQKSVEMTAYDLADQKTGYKHKLEVVDDDTYKTKIRVMLQANELPDVFYTWGGSYSKPFLTAKALYPVEDAIKETGYKFNDVYVKPGSDGHVYWVTKEAAEAYCLFYNKSVLEKVGVKAPTTWDELVNVINACQKAGISALGLGEKDRWEGDLVYNMLVLRQDKDAFSNAVNGKAAFTDDAFKKAADQVLELVKTGAFRKGYLQASNDECGQLLLQGQIAMYPTGPWMLSNFDKDTSGNIGFVPFPATGKEDAFISCCGNATDAGLAVSANSKYPKEAARYAVEYAKAVNDSYAKAGRLTFIETDIKPDTEPPALDQAYREYLAGLKNQQLWWYTYLDTSVGEPMRDLSQQLFAGAITSDEFVKKLTDIMGKK